MDFPIGAYYLDTVATHGIGDFEQLVLLAVLRLDQRAYAADIRDEIAMAAERRVTRGALYATLDRLVTKRLVEWDVDAGGPARGGIPRRRFRLTPTGVSALKRSYRAVQNLTHGLERLLGEA